MSPDVALLILVDAHSLEEDTSLASSDESIASLDFSSGHDECNLKVAKKVVCAQRGISKH